MKEWEECYIALGTNLGDRMDNLNRAVAAMGRLPDTEVVAVSRVYETKPIGYADQDNFYNAVIKIHSVLSARALLGACLGIEAAMGRVRTVQNGPRVMDLDLLLYGAGQCESAELTLPHPRMEERGFVLWPLCDVLPDAHYIHLRNQLDDQGVRATLEQIIRP